MSLASGDLTTLTDATAYIPNLPSQPVLQGLISRMSRMILTDLSRSSIIPKTHVQQFNGTGTLSLVLPDWPVISISSLYVSGALLNVAPQANAPVPPTAPYGYRYQVESGVPPGNPAVLELVGGAYFLYGRQNVVVNYKAGYQVTGEVPNAASYTPLAPYGIWATDQGVFYAATGIALTAIASGTPTVGQDIPPAPDAASPSSTYTFNAVDIASGIFANYGFVPYDLEQAVLEWMAERAAYRTRFGVRSQSLGGQETMSYDLSAIPPFIR